MYLVPDTSRTWYTESADTSEIRPLLRQGALLLSELPCFQADASGVDLSTIGFLHPFSQHVARLAQLWIFGVSLFRKVLLCGNGEYKFLSAVGAYQDLSLETRIHDPPLWPIVLHPCNSTKV